jgi:hypothetical protein
MLDNLTGTADRMSVDVCARRARATWPRAVRAALLFVLLTYMAALSSLAVNESQAVAHASATAGALFLRKIQSAILNDQTNSISVGADAAGGMHAAFANFSTDTNGNYHAYYDYCAPSSDCASALNWTTVTLLTVASSPTFMEEAQLQVDAQGRPRVIIATGDNGGNFQDHYFYAACNSGCTSSGNWTVTDVEDVTSNNTFIYDGNKHFFALDPQGRPRFIVDNGVNFLYVFCDSACSSAANWSVLTLDGSSGAGSGFDTAALAFNTAGQPRMLAPLTDQNTFQTNLFYWECNANDCSTNAGSWTSIQLVSPINGSAAVYSSLRVTTNGRPRFAYYGTPNNQAESLYYFWCNGACTTGTNWSFSSIGLAPASGFNTSGQEPDLALNSQDEPRLAFQTLDNTLGSGLGYASCDTSCESVSASWQKLLADTNDQLNADWNRLPPFGCSYSSWIGGYRSALVLDAAGNPRIGYDAEHYSSNCSDPSLNGQDYRSVRFVYLSTSAASHHIYLPLLRR